VIGSLLVAALAVALHVLAFPPADLGFLALVALAPWCALARRLGLRRLFLVAYIAGAAILSIGCFWIARTHPINLVLMVVPESLAFGVFALLLRALLVDLRWPAAIALPVAFTAVEALRGRWPLDGFPWLSLGYSQHAWLEVVQLSALAGVHGVTFLLACVAGALDDALRARGPRPRLLRLAPAAALLLAAAIGGRVALRRAEPPRKGPRLLLVQPDIEQRLKNESPAHPALILDRHLELMEQELARGGADLAVWSETMLPTWWPTEGEARPDDPPGLVQAREALRRELDERLFRRHGLPLLAGVAAYDGRFDDPLSSWRNAAILFDRQGRRVACYDKKVLVPGGEYLPWIGLFPRSVAGGIRSRVVEMAGFLPNLAPGSRSGVFDLNAVGLEGRAGLTICFEFAYPHLGRALVREGADFLLNVSNEAWFPDSAEFDQAIAMSTFRAAETRRTLVRCANSGSSGAIDPWGRTTLLSRAGRRHGFAGAMVVAPALQGGTTPYVRFGEWVGASCWLAILAALVVRLRRRVSASRRRPRTQSA
jgi:apolipoprotein N-acyltransferase